MTYDPLTTKFAPIKTAVESFSGAMGTARQLGFGAIKIVAIIAVLYESKGFVEGFLGRHTLSGAFQEVLPLQDVIGWFGSALFVSVWFVGLSVAAIAIHRHVLLQEQPQSQRYLARIVERRSLRFASVSFGLTLVLSLGGSLLFVLVIRLGWPEPLLLAAMAWPYLGVVMLARVVAVLPAIAVEASDVSLRHAWEITKHNTWRIVAGMAITQVPFLIGYEMLGRVVINAYSQGNIGFAVAIDPLGWLVAFAHFVVSVRFLSLLYRSLSADIS